MPGFFEQQVAAFRTFRKTVLWSSAIQFVVERYTSLKSRRIKHSSSSSMVSAGSEQVQNTLNVRFFPPWICLFGLCDTWHLSYVSYMTTKGVHGGILGRKKNMAARQQRWYFLDDFLRVCTRVHEGVPLPRLSGRGLPPILYPW